MEDSTRAFIERLAVNYKALSECKKLMFEKSETEILAKQDLKDVENYILICGEIDGTNAEKRTAQLASNTKVRLKTFDLRAAESEARRARFDFEMTSIVVDEIKWLIRALLAVRDDTTAL